MSMHYVISDIHGCYNEYIKALKKVNFNDNDTLYVLGDCIDRGYALAQDIIYTKTRLNKRR